MNRKIFVSIGCIISAQCVATTPIFTITPNMSAQSSLVSGETGTAVYQVTNNTAYTLSDIALSQMPAGVAPNTNSTTTYASQYCANPFTLTAGTSCLLKVQLTSAQLGSKLTTGPTVCFSQSKPVYCSQPLSPDRISTTVTQGSIPQDCTSNISNFNYELTQPLDASSGDPAWGPNRNTISLSPSNPDLTQCVTTSAPSTAAQISWEQQRIVAAAAYWISQKLNYCHHYNPDWATPVAQRTPAPAGNAGGYCNPATDIMPGSVYYGQQARWNYSGNGGETANNWVNNNRMWYGLDCTNYTAFLYNFAFGTNTTLGIPFDSETGFQAGQSNTGCTGSNPKVCPEDGLSPNTQNLNIPASSTYPAHDFRGLFLNNTQRAGYLICMDGTTDPYSGPGQTPTQNGCLSHGGYLSNINSSDDFNHSGDSDYVTINTLVPNGTPILKPGDILYIAGAGPDKQDQPDGTSSSIVTHGIMWTGKQVGYGANDINPALVAPNDAPCAAQSNWDPVIGAWLITDSHYQGADYRVLSQCFYLNDLWGVRRVIV